MKWKISLSCAASLLVCLLAGSAMWAQSDQPSLADVARQKSSAKSKRVVTNDEIPPSPEANNPPPRSGSSSASPTGSAPGAKADPKKAAEKSAMSAEKQTRLQELMKEHDSLEKIIVQLQQQIDSSNDPSRIANLSDVVKHAKENLVANQAEIDKLKATGASGGTQATANPPASTATPPK
jgi:hypothetical protein